MPAAPTPVGNGMAVAGLVLGIIGALAGLIPLLFFIAIPCGVLALVFGWVGRKRAKTGAAHGGMAVAGLVLGVIAVALAILGMVIIDQAVDDVDDCFDAIGHDVETGANTSEAVCD